MVLNEHDKSNRHTRKARRQSSPDRAARHANTLACGRQQSAGSGIRHQTQFHAVYREIPADDRQGQGRAEKCCEGPENGEFKLRSGVVMMNCEKMWETLKNVLHLRISENLGTDRTERYMEIIRLMEFIEKRDDEEND